MSSLVEASRLTRPPSEMPQPISVSFTESDVHMEDAGLSNSPASTVEGDSKSHTPTPRNPKSRIPEVLEPPAPETQLEVLSGDMRGMVDLINNLRSQGIEDLGLPLPRIAVVGNQSAGKSSLIEAISGIKVPRYSGTCTRCPLEITLKEGTDPTWSCRVSLRFKKRHVKSGSSAGNPWANQATKQIPFLDVHDKSEVEFALARAQMAILNPSKDYRMFADKDYKGASRRGRPGYDDEDLEVKFSPNVVVMEIIAPHVPNLSFIDLPGVIQTTQNASEKYLIDLVKDLVKDYVTKDDCLILLAVTMKDDAVNQSAAQLAHEYGSGRTIGALTKPDTVEMGDYDQWIEILRGQAHVLDHGYFVTKQPSQDSLNKGVDSTNARAQEAEFFQTMEPWCTELKDLSHRFGTLNLANYLASELGMLIRRRLPGILDNINFQRMDVEDKLAGLPAPPSDNQVRIVDRLLSDFNNEIVQKLSGAPGMNSFTQELRAKAENLLIALGHIKPRLLCLGSTTKEDKELLQYRGGRASNGGDRRGQWFNEDPGDSPGLQHEETPTPSTGPTSRTPRQLSTPTRKRAAEMVHGSSAGKRSRLLEASKLKEEYKFTLPQIRFIIESTSTPGLPSQSDPEATIALAKMALQLWKPIVFGFVDKINMMVGLLLQECFVSHFARYEKSPIRDRVFSIIEGFLRTSAERNERSIQKLWMLESTQIITLIKDDFEILRDKAINLLTNRRARNMEEQSENAKAMSSITMGDDGINATSPSTSKRGKGRRAPTPIPEDVDEQPQDHYTREIKVLAEVQAFYEIARRRFVDHVYMTIMGEFIDGIKNGLHEHLKARLGIDLPDAEDICRGLLIEDPAKEKLRRELLVKREQLIQAIRQLSKHVA